MPELWFISDTHFFHSNLLTFTDKEGAYIRPQFSSADEMNEVMVENWNRYIRPQDKVYHLGDVTFNYSAKFRELMSRLNGHKRLVLGNHDRLERKGGKVLFEVFEKISLWRGFKEFNFTCVHIPLELGQLRDGSFCVHGHLHQNLRMLSGYNADPKSKSGILIPRVPDPHYINVCVEHTNYAPIHLDEIRQRIALTK